MAGAGGSEGGDGGEKSHEPTQQKLDDARKRGDVAKSMDLSAAAAYFGLLLALATLGAEAVQNSGAAMTGVFARAETLAPRLLSQGGGDLTLSASLEAVWPLMALFLGPFILVLAVLIGQRAIVFAPEKLAFKGNRVSPIQQAKQKFGVGGLAEFFKAVVKLAAVSIVLGLFMIRELDEIVGLARAQPAQATTAMSRLALSLLTQIAVIALAIAAIDVLWQQAHHISKLRMTHQEVKEEAKRAEGDPMLKAQRRRRAEEIASNRMMVEVPKSDVVIVNPTHYAVALKWSRAAGGAPVVVAKGRDGVALRIRETAEASKVPIHRDPPTARAIEASVEIGQEIEPAHYHAVAAAIRFAEEMRNRAKERGDYE